tara:strand:- start:2237 stop:2920 length:684 start_codon:yes stop_codon:yes gene_type:complete
MELQFRFFGAKGNYRGLYRSTLQINEDYINKESCDNLIQLIDRTLQQNQKNVWKDALASDSRILSFESIEPNIVNLLEIDKKIVDIENYLGTKVVDWFVMANKTQFKEGNLGSGGGFHRDSAFSRQIKVIWYLSDVSTLNGPFCVELGTNNYSFKNIKEPGFGDTRFKWPNNYKEVSSKAGTELICDTRALHGGKPIEKGSRYALTLYTFYRKGKKTEMLSNLGLNS